MAKAAKVIERVGARYDVRKVGFGRVYTWRPEKVPIECEGGETASLTASEIPCPGCGAKHGSLVRENSTERGLEGEQKAHPWRYASKGNDASSLPY
jgi:hypothetical protein